MTDNTLFLMHPLQVFLPWSPVIEPNGLIPFQTLDAFARGAFARMPLMLGGLSEDALMFIYLAASFPVSSTVHPLPALSV